jgi:hypothetical protein
MLLLLPLQPYPVVLQDENNINVAIIATAISQLMILVLFETGFIIN